MLEIAFDLTGTRDLVPWQVYSHFISPTLPLFPFQFLTQSEIFLEERIESQSFLGAIEGYLLPSRSTCGSHWHL